MQILHCTTGKKQKELDKEEYGLDDNIYINESLCRPMEFLAYKVRRAKKNGQIESYNIWKGRLSIKINDIKHSISHIDDLIILGLAEDDDRDSFFEPLTRNL